MLSVHYYQTKKKYRMVLWHFKHIIILRISLTLPILEVRVVPHKPHIERGKLKCGNYANLFVDFTLLCILYRIPFAITRIVDNYSLHGWEHKRLATICLSNL